MIWGKRGLGFVELFSTEWILKMLRVVLKILRLMGLFWETYKLMGKSCENSAWAV